MIRIGDLQIVAVAAKAGLAGWSEHFELRKGRKVVGYAVSLEGAVRVALSQAILDQDLARRGQADIRSALASVLATLKTGLPDPANGVDSRKETT